jgi:hypothetical protein
MGIDPADADEPAVSTLMATHNSLARRGSPYYQGHRWRRHLAGEMLRDGLAGTVCRQDGGTRAYRDVFTARSGKPIPEERMA